MPFWNPWTFKIIDVVPDFPFSGSNPDYGRISVVWSKARSSHAAALLQYYSPILSSGALCNLSTSRERSLLKMLKVWQILCKKIEKQLWNAVLWPRAFACFIYLNVRLHIFRLQSDIWHMGPFYTQKCKPVMTSCSKKWRHNTTNPSPHIFMIPTSVSVLHRHKTISIFFLI